MPETDRNLSTTKRALLALKHLQDKLDALERAKHEPIAMIGTSCRFPGGVDTPNVFWTLMQQKTDAIAEVPSDRWSIDAYYSADPDAPGKMVSRYGGFVSHLYDFDAPFFRISPREALTLDPQQRLLLELGWEALESAGIAPDAISNRSVGVFAGISSIDHWQRVLARSRQTIDPYLATGNTHSVAAGRVSFLLGVTGPSLAVDTACSSSLVAIHLACQSLRQQECDLALAGGVNRIITPDASINFTKARMLSADGRCRTFDAKASGFGRAEGGGMIVLKRLSDAQADGDRIEAVILGSALNHDGRTSGLTVPNGPAQQAVIRQALNASRIDPAAVSYIETHGTGTTLGDPIEVGALGKVFGETRTRDRPLVLGAVKTNIGHLEAAAGMAGTIKAALALQHRCIPANLHLNTPNPHIDWNALPFKVPTTALPWSSGDGSRVAGVSAFGFNGTNAHLILGEPPSPPTRRQSSSSPSPTPYLLPLSARTPTALNQLAARYAQHLAARPDLNLADLCFTASVGRSHFARRLAIVASSTPELRQILVDALSGRANPACWRSHHSTGGESNSAPGSLENLAQRYVQGESIHWKNLYQQEDCRKIVLPTYPFQRQHYSIDSIPSI
jgi:acyl transferase domain-containing protein